MTNLQRSPSASGTTGLGGGPHGDRLRATARHIARGANDDAERALGELLSEADRLGDPDAVSCHVFAAALASRLSARAAQEANLYLRGFEVPQIHLFNLLANEVPQVGLTTLIANRCLARAIAGDASPVVIDVGVGTGRQMIELLELLATSAAERGGSLPERLTIVGIEPANWSLDLAERNVQRAATELGIDVTFEPFCSVAEGLAQEDWSRLAAICTSRPAINASFALHHVADVDGHDARDDVLLRLRSLDPRALVLSEPNVHHLEPDFLRRFEHCLHHFGVTFAVIDRLDIEQRDKDALKVCFFGREIADILGRGDDVRTERHESTASWHQRLARTGFTTSLDVELPPSGPIIGVRGRGGWASLDFGDETLVAVLGAVPVAGSYDVGGAVARAPSTSLARARVERSELEVYLAALAAVARADGEVCASERTFIDDQARLVGVAPSVWETSTLADVLARAPGVDASTREALVRDLVFLARVDDHYDASERATIEHIAHRLGLTEQDLVRVEASTALPPMLAGGRSWLRTLLFLGDEPVS